MPFIIIANIFIRGIDPIVTWIYKTEKSTESTKWITSTVGTAIGAFLFLSIAEKDKMSRNYIILYMTIYSIIFSLTVYVGSLYSTKNKSKLQKRKRKVK